MSEEKIISWRISSKKCRACEEQIKEASSRESERDCLLNLYKNIEQHKLTCLNYKRSVSEVLLITEKTNRFGSSIYSSYDWIKAII